MIVRSVAARLKELGSKEIDRQIVACDIDPRALSETARGAVPNSPRLLLANFLESDQGLLGGPFDVIVGNPPYVRLHTMKVSMRKMARRCLPDSAKLGAKASLWAYFPIHAYKFIKPGGRMAWVLPEIVLHSEYGKQLLHWATRNFNRCTAVSLRERCFTEDGAKERVVILLLENAAVGSSGEIEMVEYEAAADCVAALAEIAQAGRKELPKLNGHAVPHLVSKEAADAANALETCDDLKRLATLADIRIGVVTGDNRFFVLNEKQRAEAKLNRRHFQPVVGKFVDLGLGFNYTRDQLSSPAHENCRRLLLWPSPTSLDKRLAAYLAKYSDEQIRSNRTMQKRSHWQITLLGEIPDGFLRYMGKSAPRFVLNDLRSYSTNTIHSVFFKRRPTVAVKRAICLSLHSTYSQLSAEFEGRQYGSGVLKLEPSEAKRLLLAAAPNALNALSQRWDQLSLSATKNGWQHVVNDIDELILANVPALALALPIDDARAILHRVRRRRAGNGSEPPQIVAGL